MKRYLASSAVLFSALVSAGCGFGGEQSSGLGITGTWSGSLVLLNQAHPMTLTLTDSAGVVTGTYRCQSAGAGNEPCPLGPSATDTNIRIAGTSDVDTFIGAITPDPNINAACTFQAAFSDFLMDGIFDCTNGETGTFRVGKQAS